MHVHYFHENINSYADGKCNHMYQIKIWNAHYLVFGQNCVSGMKGWIIIITTGENKDELDNMNSVSLCRFQIPNSIFIRYENNPLNNLNCYITHRKSVKYPSDAAMAIGIVVDLSQLSFDTKLWEYIQSLRFYYIRNPCVGTLFW